MSAASLDLVYDVPRLLDEYESLRAVLWRIARRAETTDPEIERWAMDALQPAADEDAATECPKCGLETPIVVDGHEVDACFGDLLGSVVNACCGHGDPRRAYVRISRLHSNGTDGFVDICGGEVCGYGEWLDRTWPERLVDARLSAAEATQFESLTDEGFSPSVALDRLLWQRRHAA